jgi:FkbM family methyltransferase
MKEFIKKLIGRKGIKKLKTLLFKSAFAESDLIFLYFKNRKKNGVMMDVGVHFGESFIDYAEMGWKIIGFEPDQNNLKKMLNHPNLILYKNAVSDTDGMDVTLYASNESSGISSLTPFNKGHYAAAMVTTITLTTAMQQQGITEVDFLKIDIEGYDLFALKGFPFGKVMPEIIICEFEDAKTASLGYTYKDMGNFLLEKGYKVWLSEWQPLERYGKGHTWLDVRPYYTELINPGGWGNFIAVNPVVSEQFESTLIQYTKKLFGHSY